MLFLHVETYVRLPEPVGAVVVVRAPPEMEVVVVDAPADDVDVEPLDVDVVDPAVVVVVEPAVVEVVEPPDDAVVVVAAAPTDAIVAAALEVKFEPSAVAVPGQQ
jgi:hypothetical protein